VRPTGEPTAPALDDVQLDREPAAPAASPAGAIEYQETGVGRLPKGPAADAALAAAAAAPRTARADPALAAAAAAPRPARADSARATADARDPSGASRREVRRRALPAVAAAIAAVVAVVVWRRSRS
jgi:hypothetical protein